MRIVVLFQQIENMVEKYELDNDISVMYVEAVSFPFGIKEAFKKLESILMEKDNRTFFGISNADKNGKIIYKAAAWEKYEGEGSSYGLETFRIKKGVYIGELIHDYKNNIQMIGSTFQRLLKDPGLDKNSYCLEWYKDCDDVLCLVKLDTEKYKQEIINSN